MQKRVISEIRINAKAKVILEAFLHLEHLKSWWGVDSCFIQPKDSGLYCLTWLKSTEGIKFISSGRIKLYNPRSHLHIEDMLYINSEKPILGPFTLNIDVEEKYNHSILRIIQGGFIKGGGEIWDWYYKAVTDGWPEALIIIKKYLEESN